MTAMRRAGRSGATLLACVLVAGFACPAAWATPEDQSTETYGQPPVWGGCEQFVGNAGDIPTAQCGMPFPSTTPIPKAHRRNWPSSEYQRPVTASVC